MDWPTHNIPPIIVQNLYKSIPWCFKVAINAKSGLTVYYKKSLLPFSKVFQVYCLSPECSFLSMYICMYIVINANSGGGILQYKHKEKHCPLVFFFFSIHHVCLYKTALMRISANVCVWWGVVHILSYSCIYKIWEKCKNIIAENNNHEKEFKGLM